MVTYIYIHANFIVYLPCLFLNPLPLQVEVFTNPDNVSLAVVDFEVASDNLELLVAECRYRVDGSVSFNENPQDVA